MTREQLIEHISTKSVDEMIEMMPMQIHDRFGEIQFTTKGDWNGKIAYIVRYIYYIHASSTIDKTLSRHTTISQDKKTSCKNMLLWLFDNNLLPEYTKGN